MNLVNKVTDIGGERAKRCLVKKKKEVVKLSSDSITIYRRPQVGTTKR